MQLHQIEQCLHPKLEQLEAERGIAHRHLKRRTLRATLSIAGAALSLIGVVAIIGLGSLSQRETVLLYLLPGSLGLAAFIVYAQASNENKKARRAFQQTIKTEVYRAVFLVWNDSVQYAPESCVDQAAFAKADLFGDFNRYEGDDYFGGRLPDGRAFYASELRVQREVRVQHQDRDDYHTVPVFKGLFFVVENTLPYPSFDQPRLTIQPKPRVVKKAKKKKQPPKTTPTPKHHEGILDANFVVPTEPEDAPKGPAVPLFDQLYDLVPDNFPHRDRLPEALCKGVAHLRTRQRQNVSLAFVNQTAYLGCKHHLDFWPVKIESPLLSKARLRQVAWSFSVAFQCLETLAAGTPPTGMPQRR